MSFTHPTCEHGPMKIADRKLSPGGPIFPWWHCRAGDEFCTQTRGRMSHPNETDLPPEAPYAVVADEQPLKAPEGPRPSVSASTELAGPLSVADWQRELRASAFASTIKLVGFTISTYADIATGANAHPSMTTVANNSGITRTTANKHTTKLKKAGWLKATGEKKLPGKRGKGVKVYQLVLPRHLQT
ncbi:helix-turn-helix domain-containing protein [Streptomyces sp. HUAS TT7]|uniref:helix-turn-helix domain-containing protein n=1 Tax=Streptomyces sp. HUAS TT7 TaxID=3447507 RepID=UPI003F65BD37